MKRLYTPPRSLSATAKIGSMGAYWDRVKFARNNPEAFWSELANEYIDWLSPYASVLDDSNAPFYKWFEGGILNASQLCLDRHIEKRGDQTALIWEGESGEVRMYSYTELLMHVNRFANLLKNELSIKKGDRVVLYMPMIPEAIMAMLACARLGAPHVVVFGGFSADVLKERIIDTKATLIITADGASRRGKPYMLKPIVDTALAKMSAAPRVLVVEHNNQEIEYIAHRDYSYNKLIADQLPQCELTPVDSEDILFILHTSGSTGKPKGIVHSTAGYMLWAQYTTENVFNLQDNDVFWCTADIGWITGHTYTTYGPLALGKTTVIYEGVPTYPNTCRWWTMIERHQVSHFYTAPTAIRMLHKDGPDCPTKSNLSSLKVLGTVGEPIDPEAWEWFHETVGSGRCPIVDTWWQTETGGHMISPLAASTPVKPSSATLPLPGIVPEILQSNGSPTVRGEKGLLCITKPWPSMLRTVWGSPERYEKTYFSTVHKDGIPIYFSGDEAFVDGDGYFVITGRADDVINISGHRIGTSEVESSVAQHPCVAESAVVSRPDSLRGEQIVVFVVLKESNTKVAENDLLNDINGYISHDIGAMVFASAVYVVPGLPKTRSGKILRRILRSIARNEPLTTDTSTLEDPTVVATLSQLLATK